MKLKLLVGALALTCSSAFAAVPSTISFNVSGTTDLYSYFNSTQSFNAIVNTSIASGSGFWSLFADTDLVAGESDGDTFVMDGTFRSPFASEAVGLAPGKYYFEILTGRAKQGQFTATFAAAPVPEPETYAMMLAGLGAVGFMARRRRSN